MISRWLLLIGFFLVFTTASAQIFTEIRTGMSHREVVAETDGCTNPPFCHYYEGFVGWNDSQIKELAYRGHQGTITGPVVEFLNCRIVYPAGYDSTRAEKYPMIVMLHGAGESGRIWTGRYDYANTDVRYDNNGSNIIHGGQAHLNAVNRSPNLSNAFPGIVLWPQASYNGAWENGWDGGNLNPTGNMVIKVIEWLLTSTKNIDPDRVYTHGLSNGAKGAWDLPAKRPDLFAAMLPMSGVGSDMAQMAPILKTMPIWLFQGGTDTNPRPQAAADAIAALQAIGGDPRYTLYPNLGHGTWNTAYAEPDFFPWILSKNKKNIFVRGGDPNICPGGSLELGFSANMLAYQWTLNGVDIAGATSKDYNATATGTYAVKYKRRFGPDVWINSYPLVVGTKAASTFIPTITNSGSTIETVDLPGVDNKINLTAPNGYPRYDWYKGTTLLASNTSNTRLINLGGAGASGDAGDYTVKVLEATGCVSAPSNTISVIWNSSQPTSPRPSQPSMTGISPTEITVSWTDYSNEVRYELWRIRFGLGSPVPYTFQPWTLVKELPANTTSYTDSGLRPEATYRYVIRAILANGQGVFSLEPYVNGVTLADLIPPSAPTNLVASNIKDTQVTLSWDPSLDNDLVYKYEIYNGSTLITTLTGNVDGNPLPATTTTLTGLITGFTYFLSVRAVDFKGNYSPFAESVTVSTLAPANGLTYKYYQFTGTMPGNAGAQLVEPRANNSFDFTQTPTATGTVATFDITPRQQNDNFVFAFDGFIEISDIGTYRFYTSSDDGSRLYISTTAPLIANSSSLLINNDGAHGTAEVFADITFSSTGKFPIRVTFFEQGGGEVLTVSWRKNTGTGQFAKQVIPANKLFQTGATIVNYYSKATGDLTLPASWGSNQDGTGTAPGNFTGALNYFNIRNRAVADITSTWTVSGSGSKIIVGNGTTAIIANLNAAVTGVIDVSNNATINANNSSLPQFGVLHTNSIVNFGVAGPIAIPNAMYGNVNLVAANQYTLPLNTTIVQGNLSIANGATTTGIANNLSTLRIGGNLTINNTSGNPFPAAGPNQYSLVFTGGITHTVSFINPVDPTLFNIQADFGDVVNFTNLSGNIITLGSTQGGGLTLKGGAKLNLGNNHLVVTGRGTINNNNETGALSMTGGDLTLTTTATQNNSLYFSAGDYVRNLTTATPASNRATILTPLQVNNLVSVNTGELNTGDGYLVLRSVSDAANGTARIGPLLNGAKITGKINAQRYMSGEGRIYRYISSPVKGITAATLQQYFPITGNFMGASTGSGLSGNPSMFHYTEPNYIQFPTIGTSNLDTLRRGKGYSPFIREASAPTIMQLTGEPYQGTIPFSLTGGTGTIIDGWNLLGNPYAAPIKWTGGSTGGWSMTGVGNVAYIRENSGTTTLVKSHNGSTGSNGWDGVIAPGQAFWVRTTASNPTLSVSENAKQTTDASFYREDGHLPNTLQLIMSSASAQDDAFIQFKEEATAAFDTNLDGAKQNNSFFNLSTLTSDNKAMVINLTTPYYCTQDVKLRIENAGAGTYGLHINGVSDLTAGEKVTLIDTFLQTEKVLGESESFSFTITSDAASKADGRFVLRFEKPEVALNPVLKSLPVCEQSTPVILVGNSQPGVTYQGYFNGSPITEAYTSTGGTLEIPVNHNTIGFGTTHATIRAGFTGCQAFEIPAAVTLTRDTLPEPAIIIEPTRLVASTENASYQWYFNGEVMKGETKRELFAPENGIYEVEVSLSSCTRKSAAREYSITGLEKVTRLKQMYPNPTRSKVMIEMEQPIDFAGIRLISTVGQSLQATTTRISPESAEIDLSNLPAGLYLLQVNGQRYRVAKEN